MTTAQSVPARRVGATLASFVLLASGVVALVIVVAILLVVLKANPHNSIASSFHDAGRALARPFDAMFTPRDARLALAINWGIAAVVYVALGRLAARMCSTLDRIG